MSCTSTVQSDYEKHTHATDCFSRWAICHFSLTLQCKGTGCPHAAWPSNSKANLCRYNLGLWTNEFISCAGCCCVTLQAGSKLSSPDRLRVRNGHITALGILAAMFTVTLLNRLHSDSHNLALIILCIPAITCKAACAHERRLFMQQQ